MDSANGVAERRDGGAGRTPAHAQDQTMAELGRQFTERAAALAQKEIELAKAELVLKGKRLGMGAGAGAAGALFGVFAFASLTTAAILALAIVLDAWLAALIVAAAYGAIGGALALMAKRKVEEGNPPIPEQAIESAKADVEYTAQRVKEAQR